tara:strand:+ start:770 stop:925 length:156 start_codon:yes stop_codon:yes gene_type:complete
MVRNEEGDTVAAKLTFNFRILQSLHEVACTSAAEIASKVISAIVFDVETIA